MLLKKSRYTLFKGVKRMEEKKKWRREKEDATKYGEFISSYFAWKTLEEQKEIANHLADITEEEEE